MRYLRLLVSFARISLMGELSFRVNFLLKILVEVLWLGILLIFYKTIFSKSSSVSGWDEYQYLFFLGAYYTLEGFVETFFLENCVEFSELVRSGNLDFFLLKPIDEQFLLTFRKIDWSTAPKIFLGLGLMSIGAMDLGITFEPFRVFWFLVLLFMGFSLAYSFLLVLTSLGVWLVRNQSLMEIWWLFTNLMRYPRSIYQPSWALPIRVVFGVFIPALLAVSVPAEYFLGKSDWSGIALLSISTGFFIWLSRWFFFYSLRHYQSASS
ncbi:MAG: hypothetical protein EXR99_01960 [Gemmataceae bacterium]|nr:hypothetical protein [Gemmataceae bacterium]